MLAAALLALSGIAQAHTHLTKAVPADNSVLARPPSKITLYFSEPSRITAVTLQKDGDKEPRRVEALPKEPSDALGIPIVPLDPGKYALNWRAIGADNHVMSGTLHFTISGK
jgi:methionine-rich copper-binding protein CopC